MSGGEVLFGGIFVDVCMRDVVRRKVWFVKGRVGV